LQETKQEEVLETAEASVASDEKGGAGLFLYRILAGYLIGVSVLAPGISGSIIAIMMGIYQDILAMFSAPTKNLKRNALLVLPLAIGTVASMISFVLVFSWLFSTYEKATYLFFVGLILGTIPVVYKEVKKHGWKIAGIVAMIASFAVTFALSLAMGMDGDAAMAYTHPSFIEMIYGGFAMGGSLLVPGMSASVILMLLGLYTDLLFTAQAIMSGEWGLLALIGVFAIFMFTGVILTARFIKRAFEKIPAIAYAAVLGFIAGSFAGIATMSLQITDANFTWLAGAPAFIAGMALSLFFVYMNFKKEKADAATEATTEVIAEA